MFDRALGKIRVLDIGHYIAGPYCARLLADFGAEVIKIERPDGGDPSRRLGPFPGDKRGRETSGLCFYLNSNKKSITLNLKSDSGAKVFKELVRKADIVVENFSPRVMPGLGFTYEVLKEINSALILTSISNFSQKGPYRDYRGNDLVVEALGGWLYARGEPDREPVQATTGLGLAGYVGGLYGAVGTMTALAGRAATGTGQHVDVSIMEAAHHMLSYPPSLKNFPHNPGATERALMTPNIEECKDGYVGLYNVTAAQWRNLCLMMGLNDWADDPVMRQGKYRRAHRDEVIARMHPWLMARTQDEIVAEGQARRVPVANVYDASGVSQCPQHKAREYFVEVEHPEMGHVPVPGAPFRMAETPWQLRNPAPLMGEHNQEIYSGLLGFSKKDLSSLKRDGVI